MSNEFIILPDDAVSDLQALGESNLTHLAVTITLDKTSGTRTGGALDDATPTMLFENEPCRLTPNARPATTADAAQTRSAQAWTLVFRRGVVVPANSIVLVRGQDRDGAAVWERSVRIVDTLSRRLVSSIARYAAVDAGPTHARSN